MRWQKLESLSRDWSSCSFSASFTAFLVLSTKISSVRQDSFTSTSSLVVRRRLQLSCCSQVFQDDVLANWDGSWNGSWDDICAALDWVKQQIST